MTISYSKYMADHLFQANNKETTTNLSAGVVVLEYHA